MLSKKEFKKIKKDLAIKAASRWRLRDNQRLLKRETKESEDQAFEKTEKRLENFTLREQKRQPSFSKMTEMIRFPERIIGKFDFEEFPPTQLAKKAGIPVARIHNIPKSGILEEGFATGFLIYSNLLITNYHVFPTSESASDCAAQFLYEQTLAGVNKGYSFELNPSKFFITDENLDYTIIYVNSNSLDGNYSLNIFGFLNLIETPGKILIGQPINIIQHPSGGPKKYAVKDNRVIDILESEGLLHYTTDTQRGSSGAPAFNSHWEVAALHHSGIPYIVGDKIMSIHGTPWDSENMDDEDIQWVANEGISISRIVRQLKTIQIADREKKKLLDSLIRSTADPILQNSSKALTTNKKETIEMKDTAQIKNSNKITADKSLSHITLNFYGSTNVYISPKHIPNEKELHQKESDSEIIMIEKKQNFDMDYDTRQGYDSGFLTGYQINLPVVVDERKSEIFMNFASNTPYMIRYHHYTLVMNKDRRLLMWSASNVDFNPDKRSDKPREEFGGEDWRFDPRIPTKFQIGDEEFYKPATKVDRGHLVRRADNCWGNSEEEIEYANADTYHWTNCTPQHEEFNRDKFGKNGLWGRLENHIEQELNIVGNKAIIFAGPVLNPDDPSIDFGYGQIRYPLKFWKIITVEDEGAGLITFGFILDQEDVINNFGLEAELNFNSFKAQQSSIKKISELAGVTFDQQLYTSDVLRNNEFNNLDESFRFNLEAEIQVKIKSKK